MTKKEEPLLLKEKRLIKKKLRINEDRASQFLTKVTPKGINY